MNGLDDTPEAACRSVRFPGGLGSTEPFVSPGRAALFLRAAAAT